MNIHLMVRLFATLPLYPVIGNVRISVLYTRKDLSTTATVKETASSLVSSMTFAAAVPVSQTCLTASMIGLLPMTPQLRAPMLFIPTFKKTKCQSPTTIQTITIWNPRKSSSLAFNLSYCAKTTSCTGRNTSLLRSYIRGSSRHDTRPDNVPVFCQRHT